MEERKSFAEMNEEQKKLERLLRQLESREPRLEFTSNALRPSGIRTFKELNYEFSKCSNEDCTFPSSKSSLKSPRLLKSRPPLHTYLARSNSRTISQRTPSDSENSEPFVKSDESFTPQKENFTNMSNSFNVEEQSSAITLPDIDMDAEWDELVKERKRIPNPRFSRFIIDIDDDLTDDDESFKDIDINAEWAKLDNDLKKSRDLSDFDAEWDKLIKELTMSKENLQNSIQGLNEKEKSPIQKKADVESVEPVQLENSLRSTSAWNLSNLRSNTLRSNTSINRTTSNIFPVNHSTTNNANQISSLTQSTPAPMRRSVTSTTSSDDDDDPPHWSWIAWRSWLIVMTAVVLVMLGFNVDAIIKDSQTPTGPCDTAVFTYTITHSSFLLFQAMICLILLVTLPCRTRRWNWRVHNRAIYSRVIWIISSVILFGQVLLIPIGFAFIKSALPSCYEAPSHTFDVTYYSVLVQCCVFVFLGLPTFLLPCIFLILQIPKRHGVSPNAINNIPTIIYRLPTTIAEPTLPLPVQQSRVVRNMNWPIRGMQQARLAGEQAVHNANMAHLREFDRCAICLDEWEDGNRVKKLRCTHVFHDWCLRAWLDEHDDCPNCRARV